MELLSIIAIAVGLSLDAFAVSVTNSTVIKDLELKHGLRMSLFFGFFQMIMPILGWAAGLTFNSYIQRFDHWIAFGLLFFVGGRMILSEITSGKNDDENGCREESSQDCRNLPTLFLLSIATSIDALAVGLSFAMINIAIVGPAVIIGVITFLISFFGYFLGNRIGHKINFSLDVTGGIILIAIGIKILIEHIFF